MLFYLFKNQKKWSCGWWCFLYFNFYFILYKLVLVLCDIVMRVFIILNWFATFSIVALLSIVLTSLRCMHMWFLVLTKKHPIVTYAYVKQKVRTTEFILNVCVCVCVCVCVYDCVNFIYLRRREWVCACEKLTFLQRRVHVYIYMYQCFCFAFALKYGCCENRNSEQTA